MEACSTLKTDTSIPVLVLAVILCVFYHHSLSVILALVVIPQVTSTIHIHIHSVKIFNFSLL